MYPTPKYVPGPSLYSLFFSFFFVVVVIVVFVFVLFLFPKVVHGSYKFTVPLHILRC